MNNQPIIRLSENPTLQVINKFNQETKNTILEMRNKYGMLLGLGTSIKAFQELKTKKGDFVYVAEEKSVVNYDTTTSWIHQDAIIQPYQKKELFNVKEEFIKAFKNSEDFWAKNLENYNKSNSIKKECLDVLIIGF